MADPPPGRQPEAKALSRGESHPGIQKPPWIFANGFGFLISRNFALFFL